MSENQAENQTQEIVQDNAATQQQTDKEINFSAFREKQDILERQNNFLQQKIMEMERSQQQPQTKQHEYADDDLPTWGDIKKVLGQYKQENESVLNELRELKTRNRYNDYEETIRDYLPDVLKEEPELAQAIQNNPAMHKLAYRLAKSSDKYHENRLSKVNQNQVDRIVANNERPTPSTSRKTVMVQDENAKLEAMSDAQIMEMFNMAKAR